VASPSNLQRKAFWILLSAASGLLAGLAATAFLYLLDIATRARQENPAWIWLLPPAGILTGWIYHRYGAGAAAGHNLILDEIHDPRQTVPARMAPLVLGGTLLTHLCGGSAGREGTAVQMGASLADQLAHHFRASREERRMLLVAGAGAGFGAAIGTPLAGVIFGMEVIHVGRLRILGWVGCLVASAAALAVTHLLQQARVRLASTNASHTH
jgi:H+/Cl- antiporter ClcA